MKLTNLIEVKGYAAGRNGNLLVSLDDDLVQEHAYRTNKKEYKIRMMICTAYIDDPNTRQLLADKYTDGSVQTDRIIVVSKKFMKLFPKTKLILLFNQNAREEILGSASCDKEVDSFGHVETMAKFGIIRSRLAFDKARKYQEKFERKAASPYGRFVRKEMKNGNNPKAISKDEFFEELKGLFGKDAAGEDGLSDEELKAAAAFAEKMASESVAAGAGI